MRKNEKAKIKIKKKYGFGRKEQVDKLRFPQGYEEEGSDSRNRLISKGIIYEVQLLDWIERMDLEADGNFLKTTLVKGPKKEWEKPTDRDEIIVNISVKQKDSTLLEKNNWETNMIDNELTITLRKIIESMKRTEKCSVVVKNSFVQENDEALKRLLVSDSDLVVEIELVSLVKVEDWFKDGSTFKRTLRKGKGSSPQYDSTIKSKTILSNNYV